ncbi:SRPBCC family protein [Streptomyces fractus]|uniref:SRPBCC family protein n=1 Tax=Streptomyces fractus TaxID=641806 RepID=UPI003CE8C3A4
MKLEHTLDIPVPVAEAWKILLDVERVAPCVPGAELTASDGDEHRGRIKVKLGPIALTYTGTVTFVVRDEQARVVVLEAGGREARGNGTAKAVVTCRLTEFEGLADDRATHLHVETELTITGKPAQFGRGTLAEVSGALMDRFAENLAAELTASNSQLSEPSSVEPAVAAPLDLVASSGVLKRIAPFAVGAALLLLAFRALRRR